MNLDQPQASDQTFFESLVKERIPSLPDTVIHQIGQYRDLVLNENQKQNLTRWTSPQDFLEGHVIDALELLASGFVKFPALDLGSGVGVPGLLAAILGTGPWILVESEKRKTDFLKQAVEELKLNSVQVIWGRVENVLPSLHVSSIVVRAVGPVERIENWVGSCSTWNTLILMKGPRWKEEWAEYEKRFRSRRSTLLCTGTYEYLVGERKIYRVIARLEKNLAPHLNRR